MNSFYKDADFVGTFHEINGNAHQDDCLFVSALPKPMDVSEAKVFLEETANKIHAATLEKPSGSTFTGLVVNGDGKATVAQLGDSLAVAFAYDPKHKMLVGAKRLAESHLPGYETKKLGVDPQGHSIIQSRHVITRHISADDRPGITIAGAFGDKPFAQSLRRDPDIEQHDFSQVLHEGLRVFVMLASDGALEETVLHQNRRHVEKSDMGFHAKNLENLLNQNPDATPAELAQNMGNYAINELGSKDNVSLAFMEVKPQQNAIMAIFDGHSRANEKPGIPITSEVAFDVFSKQVQQYKAQATKWQDRAQESRHPDLGKMP